MSSVGQLNLEHSIPISKGTRRWQNLAATVVPLVIIVDGLIISLSGFVASCAYPQIAFGTFVDPLASLALSLVVSSYFVIIGTCRRNYAIERLIPRKRQLYETSLCWAVAFLLLFLVYVPLKFGYEQSNGATLIFFALGGGGLLMWRDLLSKTLILARARAALATTSIVLLSETPMTEHLRVKFQHSGLQIAKFFMLNEDADLSKLATQVLNATIKDASIDSIVVSLPWVQQDRIQRLLKRLATIPLPVHLLPDMHVAAFIEHPVIQIGAIKATEIQPKAESRSEQIAKRIYDLVFAACLSILLLPIFVLTALLIKLESPGPVIFVQTRNGLNNQPFRIYKFRTLHTMEDGPIIKQVMPNDPRLTRIGQILRHFGIDELPQLINVLKGEMSLVGPRPHAVAHNSYYAASIENYPLRQRVKPGLTGWAQVHGLRGETSTLDAMQHRVDFDVWYINHWNLWLDFKITLLTVIEVLKKHPDKTSL